MAGRYASQPIQGDPSIGGARWQWRNARDFFAPSARCPLGMTLRLTTKMAEAWEVVSEMTGSKSMASAKTRQSTTNAMPLKVRGEYRTYVNNIPKALSPGEELFAQQCQAYKFSPEREYRFCEGRKWAFDFAFPDEMIAIEIEGGTAFGKSRHSRGQGFENDARKYNAATRLGWKVYRYSTAMVQRGEAIDDLRMVIFQEDL